MTPNRLTTSLEIKKLNNMQFEGHGSVFGNVDYGGDVVLPGAFKRTLAEHRAENSMPSMFWMHDPSRVAGKWLDMSEDEKGLATKGELAPTDLGKEIHTLLKMEAVKGLSIGYIPMDTDYTSDGIRLIKEADLIEVSVVSIPMNPKAQIQHVKSRLSAMGEYVPTDEEVAEAKRDAERFLRNKGFSRKMAMQCASNLFSELLDPSVMLESSAEANEKLEQAASQTPDGDEDKTAEKSNATLEDIEAANILDVLYEKSDEYDTNRIMKQYFRS